MVSILLAVAAAAAPLQDPVRVWATVSSPTITVGEETVLELNVETDGPGPEEIALPPLPLELEVLGTSDYSQIQFTLPGGRSRLLRRQIVLQARAAGRLRIPPITVRVRGNTYRTHPLALHVVGAAPSAGGGVGGSRGPGDEVIFRSWTEPDTVYVNQQVTLRSEAMISEDAQLRLRRAPEYVPPNASGFWIHDVPNPGPAEPRMVRGQLYQAQTFLRAYFPLTPGTYTLSPAKLIYEVRRGFLYTPDTQELASDSLRILVLPLPEAGRPPSFTGAVGRFQLRARLEPAEAPAGEATALVVEVEGEGNIESLPPPVLPDIPGVQVFPPSEDAQVSADDGVLSGMKRFTWVLIPGHAGRIELPPIEYGYFDPSRRVYLVAQSDPLTLEVRSGSVARSDETPDAVRPLRTEPVGSGGLGWVRSPGFILVQFLPLAVGLWLGLRRRDRRPRGPSRRELRRRRDDALNALRERPTDDGAFLGDLAGLIRSWLADRLGEPGLRRADQAAMVDALEVHGVSRPAAESMVDLLTRIDRARFEPAPPGAMTRRRFLDEAERLLSVVDRHARPPARTRTVATASTVLLLLALAPAHPADAQEDPFRTGVESLLGGDPVAAAEAFTAFALANPDDPSGWYNLGLAAYRAGDTGRATWAWLRALRLAPRDADTRHNLELIGADRRLIRAAVPVVPLRTDELLLAASLAWLLGTAILGRAWLRGSRRAGLLGGAGVLVAVGLLGAWAAPRIGPATGVSLPERLDLRAAPSPRAEILRTLEAGAALRLVERREGWLRVTTGEGEEGWAEAGGVAEL